jgi:hypothetical protein
VKYGRPLKADLPLRNRHRSSKTLPYVLDSLSVPIQQLKFIKIREKGRKLRSPPQPTMLPRRHRSSSLRTVLPKSRPFHGISHPEIKQLFKFHIKADPAAEPDGELDSRSGAKNWTVEPERKIGREQINLPIVEGRGLRRPEL